MSAVEEFKRSGVRERQVPDPGVRGEGTAESAASVLSRQPMRANRKDDREKRRREYRVTLVGSVPENLVELISAIHASCIVRAGALGLAKPPAPALCPKGSDGSRGKSESEHHAGVRTDYRYRG